VPTYFWFDRNANKSSVSSVMVVSVSSVIVSMQLP